MNMPPHDPPAVSHNCAAHAREQMQHERDLDEAPRRIRALEAIVAELLHRVRALEGGE